MRRQPRGRVDWAFWRTRIWRVALLASPLNGRGSRKAASLAGGSCALGGGLALIPTAQIVWRDERVDLLNLRSWTLAAYESGPNLRLERLKRRGNRQKLVELSSRDNTHQSPIGIVEKPFELQFLQRN